MKKPKPVTPYQRLLNEVESFMRTLKWRHTVCAFHFPKERLSIGWDLSTVAASVTAAKTLGYDTVLTIDKTGNLLANYVKEPPQIPYEWLPE